MSDTKLSLIRSGNNLIASYGKQVWILPADMDEETKDKAIESLLDYIYGDKDVLD